jgi:hypothetical protein
MKTVVFGSPWEREATARQRSSAASQNGANRTIQQIGAGINCRPDGAAWRWLPDWAVRLAKSIPAP